MLEYVEVTKLQERVMPSQARLKTSVADSSALAGSNRSLWSRALAWIKRQPVEVCTMRAICVNVSVNIFHFW
jgi:hypothetical protein